jgi:hypothetical protein
MFPSELKLNRVERAIFGFALGIGALLVLIRVGTFLALWFSHNAR